MTRPLEPSWRGDFAFTQSHTHAGDPLGGRPVGTRRDPEKPRNAPIFRGVGRALVMPS